MIGALCGVGALVGALRGKNRRLLIAVAVSLLVLLPTSLPRAASGVRLAFEDLKVADPAADDSGHHYRDRMLWGWEIEASWELYVWLHDNLPTEARLLTPRPHLSASAAGVASPLSHRDQQLFNATQTTWVYEDALRFLHRDDLADLGITHLHVTDRVAADLAPSARRLLYETAVQRKAENIPPTLTGAVMRAILSGGRYPRSQRSRQSPGTPTVRASHGPSRVRRRSIRTG